MIIIATVIIAIIVILLLSPFILLFICAVVSGKYDYDYVQLADGSWKIEPVFHPCGESIDEEFIKEWKRKKKLYDKYVKDFNRE